MTPFISNFLAWVVEFTHHTARVSFFAAATHMQDRFVPKGMMPLKSPRARRLLPYASGNTISWEALFLAPGDRVTVRLYAPDVTGAPGTTTPFVF